MNKKLIFRIIGALASSLIVVSVFVPFISVEGFSQSIWEANEVLNALYLPIMIIAFGILGIIFFALNVKTEFAYMSSGAILFFTIMRTVDIVNQNAFDTLGIGYYFLAIGSILVGIMAFLCNLGSKKTSDESSLIENNSNTSMLNQVEQLYNEPQQSQENIQPIQPVNNLVEPIVSTSIPDNIDMNLGVQQSVNQDVAIPESKIQQPINEYNQYSQVVPEINNSSINSNVPPLNSMVPPIQSNINPVVQEFTDSISEGVNTVVQQPGPVLDQNNLIDSNTTQPPVSTPNPVVQEFINSSSNVPLDSQNISGSDSHNGTDIFGQPINK